VTDKDALKAIARKEKRFAAAEFGRGVRYWTPEKGPHWIKVASLLLPKDQKFKPNTKHTLTVKVFRNAKGRKEMVCACNGYQLQYVDDSLPDEFEGDAEKYMPQGEGAESFAQIQARLCDFLEKELRPQDGKVTNILCVTHSLVLKSLVRELAGDGASTASKKTLQPNCCVHVVRYEEGRFSLVETGRIYYGKKVED